MISVKKQNINYFKGSLEEILVGDVFKFKPEICDKFVVGHVDRKLTKSVILVIDEWEDCDRLKVADLNYCYVVHPTNLVVTDEQIIATEQCEVA
jgi:hypothetical protein